MKIKSVRISFEQYLYSTEKAILILYCSKEHWIPKQLCKNLVVNKKMKGHVSIPSFFYEKMGYEPTQDIADVIVTHHVPEKKEQKNKYDSSLFKPSK